MTGVLSPGRFVPTVTSVLPVHPPLCFYRSLSLRLNFHEMRPPSLKFLSTMRSDQGRAAGQQRPVSKHRAARAARLFGALAISAIAARAASPGIVEKSGEWDRIQDGEYLVENCTFNVKAAHHQWRQTIFCDPATGCRGWRWDFSGENGEIKTYPEIIFGRKPFDVYRSTTPRLPVLLSAAVSFRLEYRVFREIRRDVQYHD